MYHLLVASILLPSYPNSPHTHASDASDDDGHTQDRIAAALLNRFASLLVIDLSSEQQNRSGHLLVNFLSRTHPNFARLFGNLVFDR